MNDDATPRGPAVRCIRCPECKSLETEPVTPVTITATRVRLDRCRDCGARFEARP
jgi:hypothetical protein